MTKKLFLEKLMHERDKFELMLNRVGFARRMTLKGVSGKWSIKDILAHTMAYELYIADRMNEIVHNEQYTPCKTQVALDAFLEEFGYPDFGSPLLDNETPGTWVVERYRNVSLEEVVAQELQAFSSILATLEGMPEKTIDQHHLYDRIATHTYKQYREHLRSIRSWLRVNAVDLKK